MSSRERCGGVGNGLLEDGLGERGIGELVLQAPGDLRRLVCAVGLSELGELVSFRRDRVGRAGLGGGDLGFQVSDLGLRVRTGLLEVRFVGRGVVDVSLFRGGYEQRADLGLGILRERGLVGLVVRGDGLVVLTGLGDLRRGHGDERRDLLRVHCDVIEAGTLVHGLV